MLEILKDFSTFPQRGCLLGFLLVWVVLFGFCYLGFEGFFVTIRLVWASVLCSVLPDSCLGTKPEQISRVIRSMCWLWLRHFLQDMGKKKCKKAVKDIQICTNLSFKLPVFMVKVFFFFDTNLLFERRKKHHTQNKPTNPNHQGSNFQGKIQNNMFWEIWIDIPKNTFQNTSLFQYDRKGYCPSFMMHLKLHFDRISHSFAFTGNTWRSISTHHSYTTLLLSDRT